MQRFYIGLHQASDAQHFDRCCIHVNRLNGRRKPLGCDELLLDSQAFNMLRLHGRYPEHPRVYAAQVQRIVDAQLVPSIAAVTQDYMCEAFMLERTGLTVADHQRLTISRYDTLHALMPRGVYLMPVLQGYQPQEYVAHIRQYGRRLAQGMWVGVGSVCKRNGNPGAIAAVLLAIKGERPDLRMHGFGLKATAVENDLICALLETADSLAWSYAERKRKRHTGVGNANDWRAAARYRDQVMNERGKKSYGYQHTFI